MYELHKKGLRKYFQRKLLLFIEDQSFIGF